MKKILFVFAMLVAVTACNTTPTVADYTVAKNYFFKNNQEIPDDVKITSEEEFHKLFGMATVMGADGKPTAIDFSKQFVIAVVLPVTYVATEIVPERVEVSGDSLLYFYSVKTGDEQSYSIQPISIIILDRQYVDKAVKAVSM